VLTVFVVFLLTSRQNPGERLKLDHDSSLSNPFQLITHYHIYPQSLINQLHGTQPFVRSSRSLIYTRISQQFMELEDSLPYSQQPSIDSYPELEPVHTTASCCSKVHFKFILPYVLVFLVVSFRLAFPPKSYMHSTSVP
jgi:hypothetical protein